LSRCPKDEDFFQSVTSIAGVAWLTHANILTSCDELVS